jgi:hypothetical protein
MAHAPLGPLDGSYTFLGERRKPVADHTLENVD